MSDTLDELEREVAAADWRDLPRGYYAFPLVECDDPFEVVGYRTYRRRTSTVIRTGRKRGRDDITVSVMVRDGITRERFTDYLDQVGSDPVDVRQLDQTDIWIILDEPAYFQAEFGKLTGRCGCCGRGLTDPDSKMRGLGPECAKGLAG